VAFIIDAFDREVIAWSAVCGAGISGSDVRYMMLEAVETCFDRRGHDIAASSEAVTG
jgi:putative transposase